MPNSPSESGVPRGGSAGRAAGRFLGVLVMVALFAGCAIGSESRDYPGQSVDHLFDCTVAVAEDPTVDQWHVIENNAWVSRGDRRVELMRVIERKLEREGALPEVQRQTWSMTLRVLAAAPDGDPETGEVRTDPQIRIESRSSRPPAQFWAHADELFNAIDAKLNDPARPSGRSATPPVDRARKVAPGQPLESP